jgi:hypothetical protein
VEAVQCSCTSMAQCMRHAPLDIFAPSCLDMHGEYILTHTGIILFLSRAPIMWFSKKQNTVESSTFGSEFVALRITMELI